MASPRSNIFSFLPAPLLYGGARTFEPLAEELLSVPTRCGGILNDASQSWLNMVEIEIGVLARQCLDRRIDSFARLVTETAAWEKRRNADRARVKSMFTTETARAKMARAYPRPSAKSGQFQTSQNLCVEVLDDRFHETCVMEHMVWLRIPGLRLAKRGARSWQDGGG